MKLKEAIQIMEKCGNLQLRIAAPFVKAELRKLKAELRLTQKALKGQAVNESRIVGQLKSEKRDMWGAMSEACHNYSPLSKACYGHVAKTQPCSMASCPLLRKAVKR